jgi:DNA-binding CsgD family transcriptional regulator
VRTGLDAVAPESSYDAGVARLTAAGFRALAERRRRGSARRPGDDEPAEWWDGLATELDVRLASVREGTTSDPEVEAYVRTAEAEAATRAPSAGRMWRDARASWLRAQQPYREAYALLRIAQAALRSSHRDRAVPPLRACIEIAASLGATPLLQQAQETAIAARIGDDVARKPVSTGAAVDVDLTKRESEVLRLVIDGATNRQIAQALYISERTVGVHVSNLLRKLGVRNRTEAVTEVLHRGWVDASH